MVEVEQKTTFFHFIYLLDIAKVNFSFRIPAFRVTRANYKHTNLRSIRMPENFLFHLAFIYFFDRERAVS